MVKWVRFGGENQDVAMEDAILTTEKRGFLPVTGLRVVLICAMILLFVLVILSAIILSKQGETILIDNVRSHPIDIVVFDN